MSVNSALRFVETQANQNILVVRYAHLRPERYLHVRSSHSASLTAITFDEEINFIWELTEGAHEDSQNRYYGLAAVISIRKENNPPRLYSRKSVLLSLCVISSLPSLKNWALARKNDCQHFIVWQGVSSIAISVFAQSNYPIPFTQFNGQISVPSRLILLSVVTLFIASNVVSWVIMGGHFCLASNSKVTYFRRVLGVPTLVFEVFLLVLAVRKGLDTRRTWTPLSFTKRSLRLSDVLFRDSLIYFFGMGATYLTTLIIWALSPAQLQEASLGFDIVLPCVISNRLILNIRGTARAQEENVVVDGVTQDLSGADERVSQPILFS
ncbi:hypothetical protein CPC08DRAFT_728787 [Agrocybe pediades]|nr:hypothetical protein CPC08DRAFT_728787 [Agrocybe pediades]